MQYNTIYQILEILCVLQGLSSNKSGPGVYSDDVWSL